MRSKKSKVLSLPDGPLRGAGKLSFKLASGQMIILAIIFMLAITILASSLFGRTVNFLRFGHNSLRGEQAQGLADAGLDYALLRLNETAGSYAGDSQTLSIGSFTTTVTTKTPTLKTITSIGYVPNAISPLNKRAIKTDVIIDSTIIAFNYAVQVGIGGVSLGQSATINGSVYSNKTGSNSISGNQGSVITGDAWSAGSISTPNPAVQGTKHENQQASQMPTVDYQQWKDTATSGGTIDCAQTPAQCNLTSPGVSVIGNKKYIGSVSLGQSKVVTLNGPVYITGNLDFGQSSQMDLDNSFGSNSTILILDGVVTLGQSSIINPTNANPKGYIMIVTTSTADPAINLGQSAANAILYALDGGARLGQSAHATAIISNKLTLGQSAILTYDQGLASTDITSGPGGSWQAKKGTYRFTSSP